MSCFSFCCCLPSSLAFDAVLLVLTDLIEQVVWTRVSVVSYFFVICRHIMSMNLCCPWLSCSCVAWGHWLRREKVCREERRVCIERLSRYLCRPDWLLGCKLIFLVSGLLPWSWAKGDILQYTWVSEHFVQFESIFAIIAARRYEGIDEAFSRALKITHLSSWTEKYLRNVSSSKNSFALVQLKKLLVFHFRDRFNHRKWHWFERKDRFQKKRRLSWESAKWMTSSSFLPFECTRVCLNFTKEL